MIEPNIHKMKTDRAWGKLYSRLAEDNLLIESEKKKKYILLKPAICGVLAAAVLVGLIYGVSFFMTVQDEACLPNLLSQENIDKSTLVTTLEDGSVVYLAQKSSLKFPAHFASDGRNVELQGDAYFDITKNKKRPFMIETENVRIKVLGTAFDVRTKESSSFSLSVQRGCVSVTLKKNGEQVYVKAGEMVTLQNNQLSVIHQQDSAWFDRYKKGIRFKDESLENIIRAINLNSLDLKLQASAEQGKRKLTVEFSDSSPEVVAELVSLALNIKIVRQENILLLSE